MKKIYFMSFFLLISYMGKSTLLSATEIEDSITEAREAYYSAIQTPGLDEEKILSLLTLGRDKALTAEAIDPKNSSAIIWCAANEGKIAQLAKNLRSLNTISKIERKILAVKKRDPDFGFAAADRILGELYLEAPVFISIGSKERAEKRIRDALNRFPDFPGNQLALAKFFVKTEKTVEAKSLALKVGEMLKKQTSKFGEFSRDEVEWKKTITTILTTKEKAP